MQDVPIFFGERDLRLGDYKKLNSRTWGNPLTVHRKIMACGACRKKSFEWEDQIQVSPNSTRTCDYEAMRSLNPYLASTWQWGAGQQRTPYLPRKKREKKNSTFLPKELANDSLDNLPVQIQKRSEKKHNKGGCQWGPVSIQSLDMEVDKVRKLTLSNLTTI